METANNPITSTNHQSFIGTSMASKMLGLSVTSVQKLVDSGLLPGFSTKGKHRRIPYEAVIDYYNRSQSSGSIHIPHPIKVKKSVRICVLAAKEHLSDELMKISNNQHFELISNPLQLMENSAYATHAFIDANIPWIEWQTLNKSQFNDVTCIIYNAHQLNPEDKAHLQKFAALREGSISVEFLEGYQIALNQIPFKV